MRDAACLPCDIPESPMTEQQIEEALIEKLVDLKYS